MAALQERISALEAKIEGYEQEYANASLEEKKELRPLITESKKTLNLLLQQQQQQQQGEFVPVTSKSLLFLHRAVYFETTLYMSHLISPTPFPFSVK